MKTIAIALASAFAIAPAFAQWDGPYYGRSERYSYNGDTGENARVIASTPVYANGREECYNERTGGFEQRHGNRAQDFDLNLDHCRRVSAPILEGYDVRYRYAGREYVTRLAGNPGGNLRVGTDINWDGTPIA